MAQILYAVATMVAGILLCVIYFWGSNAALDRLLPATGARATQNIRRANAVRPWLFLGPSLMVLVFYLVYPALNSIWLSLHHAGKFVGTENYVWLFGDAKFRESVLNNLLWLIIVPGASTVFGLFAAALTDRIAWGNVAKSLIFMPMAISFVGAAVIWKFVYDYRGPEENQIGVLNAVVTQLGGDPVAWLITPFWNNFYLMAILIWIQTGFAMVILGAALRGIPEETIEAAILDGAGPLRLFFRIKIPQIRNTIAVVWTTITILVLKIFDIVFAMTNGQWGTQVLANMMYDWSFRAADFGRGSAIAVILMLAVIPLMLWNINNVRKGDRK